MTMAGSFSMMARRRQKSTPMYREMDYLQHESTQTVENDALVRFYAMLNVIVTFKGRPTYEIEKSVMDIKIKQPLGKKRVLFVINLRYYCVTLT